MTNQRQTLRHAFAIGAIITLVVSAFVLLLDFTADPDARSMHTDRLPLPVPLTVFAAVLLGMGLGTQLSLLRSNWHRIHAVLRPNKGRVICCIVFTSLAPIAHWDGIPISYIFCAPPFFGEILSRELPTSYKEIAPVVLILLYPLLFYIFSSLIISGIKSHLVRAAIFGQIWLAAYGAALMITGFTSVNL